MAATLQKRTVINGDTLLEYANTHGESFKALIYADIDDQFVGHGWRVNVEWVNPIDGGSFELGNGFDSFRDAREALIEAVGA